MPPSYIVSLVPFRGELEYQGPPAIVCGHQDDTVVVKTALLQFDDNFINRLVHTGQYHVPQIVWTLLESIFPSFVTDHLPELLGRNSNKWSVNCHEGEVEKHRFALVVLLNYLLGLLNINVTVL